MAYELHTPSPRRHAIAATRRRTGLYAWLTPYEFSSTEMCAQVSTDDPEQPPDESDAATRAVLAAAAVVAALVF